MKIMTNGREIKPLNVKTTIVKTVFYKEGAMALVIIQSAGRGRGSGSF